MEINDVLIEIAKQTPSIGILIYFVMYFQKDIRRKDEELIKLNDELRETEKESIRTLGKLIVVIEDLKELIKEKIK